MGAFPCDGGGNFIAVDLDPGTNGKIGQIINYGRDISKQDVIASSLADFISLAIKQIYEGNIEIITEDDGFEYWEIKDPNYVRYGVHLDIIEYGKQTTKIFFIPHIQIVTDNVTPWS